jgi:hypothetical protein
VSADPHTPGSGTPPGKTPGLLGAAVREVTGDIIDTARLRRRQTARGLRRAWEERPPVARALAWIFLAGTLVSGATTAIWPALVARSLPGPADWAAARALLERDARPGDAVALDPAWAERAREVLPASTPVLAAASLAGEDLPGVRRVWVVSLPGVPRPPGGAGAALARRAASPAEVQRLGALVVSRLELAEPFLPLAFLPDQLESLSVWLGEESCPAEAGGFRCGDGPGALRVRRSLREVAGVARPCLVLAPLGPLPAPLALRFAAVPAGREVRGHAGVTGVVPPGARLGVTVLLDGEEAGAVELTPDGFAPFRVETGRFAGRTRALALVLTAPRPVGEVCLDGMTAP